MPLLDVSEIVVDPDLADSFSVIRRVQSVDPNTGRVSVVETAHPDLFGVVTQQDPAALMRGDDQDHVNRLIFVASTFKFRNVSQEDGIQYKGDIIVWPPAGQEGSTQYTVLKVYSYSRYGAGITECVAQSMNAIDEAL